MNKKAKPYYGIDAPYILLICSLIAIALICAILGVFYVLYFLFPFLTWFIAVSLFIMLIFLLYPIITILIGSCLLKFRERDWLLDSLEIKGDERILDVGCGRGLLLIGAAKRLKTGRAIGIDIWQSADQTSNSPQATLRNAELEDVVDKIEVITADARNMPFNSSSFDMVVSSWALHNISDKKDRQKALSEITRVLKSGGIIAIMDIDTVDEYETFFKQGEFKNVMRIGPRYTFGNATYIIRATKIKD